MSPEIYLVEWFQKSIIPIVERHKNDEDFFCTDGDILEFLQDIHSGKEKSILYVSSVDWENRKSRQDKEGHSDVILKAVKLPDGRYYLTVELLDLDIDEIAEKEQYVLEIE